MDGTLADFAAIRGAFDFTENLASSLGVDQPQVQIVSITEGSIIVVSDIVVAEDQSIDELKAQVNTATAAEGGLNLGLPVNYVLIGAQEDPVVET